MRLLLAALSVVGAFVTCALAEAGNIPIKIRVESILANNKIAARGAPLRVEMDKRLKQLNVADRLMMMFGYSSYRLLRHQEDNTTLENAVAFNLPGGHILHVCPLGFRGNALMVALEMFEGERMILRMPMRLTDDGLLMLVDEHQPGQYYITAISADMPPFDGPSRVQIDPRQLAPMPAFPLLVPAQ